MPRKPSNPFNVPVALLALEGIKAMGPGSVFSITLDGSKRFDSHMRGKFLGSDGEYRAQECFPLWEAIADQMEVSWTADDGKTTPCPRRSLQDFCQEFAKPGTKEKGRGLNGKNESRYEQTGRLLNYFGVNPKDVPAFERVWIPGHNRPALGLFRVL